MLSSLLKEERNATVWNPINPSNEIPNSSSLLNFSNDQLFEEEVDWSTS